MPTMCRELGFKVAHSGESQDEGAPGPPPISLTRRCWASAMNAMYDHIQMLAAYNRWANARLYDAVARMSDSDYRADLGAFFHSVHGTLNHILVADRIWIQRFTGQGDAPRALDTILYEDFAALRAAREAEDDRIAGYIETLDDAKLSGTFRYRTISKPADIEQPLMPALLHFFNHQTHHRGQIHALLTRTLGDAPSLDLIYFQRETGVGLTR